MLSQVARKVRILTRRSEIAWRYGYHLPDVVAYRMRGQAPISSEAARVSDELSRRGVAMTSVKALLGADPLFTELLHTVGELQNERAAELADIRSGGNAGAQKTFNYEFLDGVPLPGSIYTRFTTQPAIMAVSDRYFGFRAKLRATNVWLTLVSGAAARQSQLWHRDPEDRYILKMFVLLSDVDEGAGPFHYAAGSHMKSRNGPVTAVDRHGLSDEEMATLVPREGWVTGVGPAGTIIFADTRGYHKGGLARAHERLVFVSLFLGY